ncbi:glycosyltransferase family 2 protein [Actinoplanes sp. NPDC051851]|uniref:glycosyltransferase family 2 protein n=1 Tax=Actinoplanes sp. NPDC051851 TaxID=3154753 RepID=UPI003446975D
MRIAAIVVAYNSARDLPESLGCLGALPVERSVVVDNSSADDSATVAKRYTPDVLSAPNDGFGAAINLAARAVPEADAYLLLNPDCRLDPEAFATLVAALENDPGLGVVAPLMRYPNGGYGVSSGSDPSMAKEWLAALRVDHLVPAGLRRALARSAFLRSRIRMLAYLDVEPSAETRAVEWVSGFCMLVRASAFREIGGFDPGYFLYFEDVDLCKRLRAAGWGVASVGASVADHKESTSTAAVGKNRLYRDGMAVYFDRHGTSRQRTLATALRKFPL